MMMTEILTPLEEELLQALQALMEETITANTSDKVRAQAFRAICRAVAKK